MIFDLNEEILDSIDQAMKAAEEHLTGEQIVRIVEQIDSAVPGVIQLLVGDTEAYWEREAVDSGTGWGWKYAKAIKGRVGQNEGNVFLDGSVKDNTNKPSIMFAMMVEKGVKSWSIKKALLESDRARTSKDGIKYIVVPFPVATPKQKGTGRSLSRFGGREMTSEIHDVVKGGGRIKEGDTAEGKDISGLSRWETRKFHSQYGIFRCVSEKSQGWQYPNVAPTPVFSSVKEYVDKRIAEVLSEFCKEIIRQNS